LTGLVGGKNMRW